MRSLPRHHCTCWWQKRVWSLTPSRQLLSSHSARQDLAPTCPAAFEVYGSLNRRSRPFGVAATSAKLRGPGELQGFCGAQGWATPELPEGATPQGGASLAPLLDLIVRAVPAPGGSLDAPPAMLVTMIDEDPFVGRIATGRISSGTVRIGDRLKLIKRDGVAATPPFSQRPSVRPNCWHAGLFGLAGYFHGYHLFTATRWTSGDAHFWGHTRSSKKCEHGFRV